MEIKSILFFQLVPGLAKTTCPAISNHCWTVNASAPFASKAIAYEGVYRDTGNNQYKLVGRKQYSRLLLPLLSQGE